MTSKVIFGPIIDRTTDASNNLVLTYECYIIGPEVITFFGGLRHYQLDSCQLTIDGTETLAQLGTKLTDCAMTCVSNAFTGQITVARSNVYLPSYVKGV
jgi:hypothetical protein